MTYLLTKKLIVHLYERMTIDSGFSGTNTRTEREREKGRKREMVIDKRKTHFASVCFPLAATNTTSTAFRLVACFCVCRFFVPQLPGPSKPRRRWPHGEPAGLHRAPGARQSVSCCCCSCLHIKNDPGLSTQHPPLSVLIPTLATTVKSRGHRLAYRLTGALSTSRNYQAF